MFRRYFSGSSLEHRLTSCFKTRLGPFLQKQQSDLGLGFSCLGSWVYFTQVGGFFAWGFCFKGLYTGLLVTIYILYIVAACGSIRNRHSDHQGLLGMNSPGW